MRGDGLSTFPRASGQSGGTRKQSPDASPAVKHDAGLARGKSRFPAEAKRMESAARLAVAFAAACGLAGTQNGATPHAERSFIMIPMQEACGNL